MAALKVERLHIVAIVVLLSATACRSPVRGDPTTAVGLPITDLYRNADPQARHWRYTTSDGEWVYVETFGSRCEFHYFVNKNDLIVGYKILGAGCEVLKPRRGPPP